MMTIYILLKNNNYIHIIFRAIFFLPQVMDTMDFSRAHHSKNESPISHCKNFEYCSNYYSQLRLWCLGPRLSCCRNPQFLSLWNSWLCQSPLARTGPSPFAWRCVGPRPENWRPRRPIRPSWPGRRGGWRARRANSPPMCCRQSPTTNFPISDPI